MSSDRAPPTSKAGTSLSERIAALQRKTSNSTTYSSSPTPNYSGGSTSSSRSAEGSRNGAGSSSSRGVRDRIAKFQFSDEKPVLPRSSFGSPAPNPEISHARRQFPGASAGKGSGAWGEGVLRPQMTGGVWLGAGAGGGWGDPSTAPMRPQMTGGASLGMGNPRYNNGAPKPQRGVSDNVIHGTGRDAFADLDDDLALTQRHLARSPDESPADKQRAVSESIVQRGMPLLPDTPTAEIDISKIDFSTSLPEEVPEEALPDFPEAPSDAPELSSKLPSGMDRSEVNPDTSVEISVQVRSPGDFDKIRQRAQELELSEPADTSTDEPWLVSPSEDTSDSVPKPVDTDEVRPAIPSADDAEQTEEWVQGFGAPTAAEDLKAAEAAASNPPPADYNAVGTLPERANVAQTETGEVDPNDPAAHQILGPGLLVPRDEIAEATDLGPDAVHAPLAATSSIASEDAHGTLEADTSVPNSYPSADLSQSTSNQRHAISLDSTLQGSTRPLAPTAVSRTKSQSQRLRRPPPGTVLSAADLDASDDEYEPGWASVTSFMSSSRP